MAGLPRSAVVSVLAALRAGGVQDFAPTDFSVLSLLLGAENNSFNGKTVEDLLVSLADVSGRARPGTAHSSARPQPHAAGLTAELCGVALQACQGHRVYP